MTEDEARTLSTAVADLRSSIDSLRRELVRQDVYAADQKTLALQLKGIEDDVAEVRKVCEANERKRQAKEEARDSERKADRRLLFVAVIAPTVMLFIQYLVTRTFPV
jgi:hypothetical protein